MYQINDTSVGFHVTDMCCESVIGLVTCGCVQKPLLMAGSFFVFVSLLGRVSVDTNRVIQ